MSQFFAERNRHAIYLDCKIRTENRQSFYGEVKREESMNFGNFSNYPAIQKGIYQEVLNGQNLQAPQDRGKTQDYPKGTSQESFD
jgi:hypothetical protein